MSSESDKKRRKLRSPAWMYFESADERDSGKCKLCQSDVKTPGGSTTSLLRHLESIHGIKLVFSETVLNNGPGSGPSAKSSLEEVISKLVAKDGISFNAVASSETMRNAFEFYGYQNFPTDHSSVRNLLLKFYEGRKEDLAQQLSKMFESGQKVAVTLDEWSSAGHRRYMNVNLHSTGGQFWNLGLARISGSLNAGNALDLLRRKLLEFGVSLEKHVVAVVSDGASVMRKMGTMTGVDHQLCFVHGIHLAVMDLLYKKWDSRSAVVPPEVESENDEEDDLGIEFIKDVPDHLQLNSHIGEVIAKVRKTVKIFHKSPLKEEKLHKYTSLSKKKALGLILDCKTRWNSMLLMLERFLFIRQDVQKALIDLKEPDKLSQQDYQLVQDLVNLLAPVKVAVEAICRRNATLITCDVSLGFMLDKIEAQKTVLGNRFYNELQKRILERRTILSEIARFINYKNSKSVGVVTHLQAPEKYSNDQIAAKIMSLYDAAPDDPHSASPLLTVLEEDCTESPLNYCLENELQDAIDAAEKLSEEKSTSSAKLTLATTKTEMALLENGEPRGRILGTVYDYLKTIPPSSVEAEHAFSCANNFCTRIRSRLADDTLDALVFVKYYFKNSS